MLQINKDQAIVESRPDIISAEETLALFVGFVRRQYPVVVFVMLLAFALGLVYVITAPARYTAHAKMLIDTRKIPLFQQQSISGDVPMDSASVESQVEVLKSDNVALSVIKDLHLTEDPEFARPSGGLIGTFVDFISNPFGSIASSSELSESDLTRQALRVFQANLAINRVGLTYVIEIAYRSLRPERAAQITNAVADAYIVDQLEAKYQATRRASAWLQVRIRELRDQASTAQRAVVTFKTKNNIVESGGQLLNEQQVAQLNSQLMITQGQTSEARARLDRIETVLRADAPDATVNSTVADTLTNDVITKLRSQYLEYAQRLADWTARVGPDHLAVIRLRNEMTEIRKSILDELRRIAESYKSDYQIAKQHEESIQRQLSQAVSQSQTTNQAQVNLRELQSNAETYQALYDNFLQRYMESVQQQSFPTTEARVISPAGRPQTNSHPRTFLILAISGFGGLICGFGLGILRDLSDRVFRTSDQVESLLQTGCLALVPLVKAEEIAANSHHPKLDPSGASQKGIAEGSVQTSKKGQSLPDPRKIVRNEGPMWAVIDAPFSRFSEAIRAIKLAMDLNGVVKTTKVIGFTSSLPNEGKSTIATALAQLVAHSGRSVILVDCDIRNPSLSHRLTPNANAGILEVLAGKMSLEEVVCIDASTNLVFLPAVTKSRLAHSSEILGSSATKRLFDQLRQNYEYVVVDLSPLAPIIDVRMTTQLVDSYIFVIEWGRTKIDVAQHALSQAEGVYENLIGAVLNKADMNLFGRYESHRENYYYNKNYSRYGYTE